MIISSRIKRPYTFICGMIFLLVTGFILLIYDRYLSVVPGIVISHESGFYNDAIEITVQDTKVDKIFFQINGEEPINQYNSPICLEGSYDGNSYSVVFWYQDQEGVLSEPIERNYLVLNGDRSISTDYVVMLWGNEEELFGYEDGILVAGKSFDEFMERTPDFSLYGTRPVGNYSSNAERLVHTVFMDKAGNELITQNCGVRVSGNWTRAKAQKSLKLTARKTYDEKNEFSYPFFEDYFPEDGSRLIEDYHSLVLHSSGNDNGNGFIRNA